MHIITFLNFIVEGIFKILLNQAVLLDLIATKIDPKTEKDEQIVKTARRMSEDTEKLLQHYRKRAENEQHTTET